MIRFKKDDGTDYPDWEEKSIESIASVFGGYAFDSKKMTSIPLKYQIVKMGNLYQGNLDLTRTPSYIEQINEKELNYLLQKGDIAITLTGTVNKHDFGYSYLFVDEENLLLNQRLGLIRKKDNNDSRFISYIVKGNTFLRQFYNAATGGTGNQTNVSTKSVEKISVLIPHPDEQKKIADFLSEVDNMISIQKQQLAAIEEQKKGVMQKIFSQEMRFKKDDGKDYPVWEEKAFYDVFALKPNNTLSRDKLNYCSGTVQNIHYGDILVRFGSNLDSNNSMIPYINDNIDISKYSEESYLKNGDIILADTAEDFSAGKVTEIFNVNNKKLLSGLHTMLCRPVFEFSSKYLGYYMNSEEYHKQIVPLLVGTKVYSINKKVIAKTKIKIPDLDEQKKIANFLSEYDKAIEIKRKKLDTWKTLKKGLLQQMLM